MRRLQPTEASYSASVEKETRRQRLQGTTNPRKRAVAARAKAKAMGKPKVKAKRTTATEKGRKVPERGTGPPVGTKESLIPRREKGKDKPSGTSEVFDAKTEALMTKRDDEGKPPCYDHIAGGSCKFGNDCSFSHTVTMTREEKEIVGTNAKRWRESRSKSPVRKSNEACRAFTATGTCYHGDNCRYKHAVG